MKSKPLFSAVFFVSFMAITSLCSAQPLGTIMAYGLDAYANKTVLDSMGWRVCDGSKILKSDCGLPALFDQLSTTYGSVNASEAYLPDLRGMFLRGVSEGGASKPIDSLVRGSKENRFLPQYLRKANINTLVGTLQMDGVGPHSHPFRARQDNHIEHQAYQNGGDGEHNVTNSPGETEKTGTSKDTHPKNAFVYFIIKVK